MSRITLASLNKMAESHNKHSFGDEWTWENVIVDICRKGNDVRELVDKMSKKEALRVLDRAAWGLIEDDLTQSEERIYESIYDAAKGSLMDRL